MMLLLPANVLTHRRASEGAHSKRTIPVLPGEARQPKTLLDPNRGAFLEFPYEARKGVRGIQRNKQMYVIGSATHTVSFSVEAIDQAAEVFVNSEAIRGRQPRFTILGAEYDVVMEAEVGGHTGWHPFRVRLGWRVTLDRGCHCVQPSATAASIPSGSERPIAQGCHLHLEAKA